MDDFEAIRRRATDENNNWPGWAQTDRRMLFTHIAALEARCRELLNEYDHGRDRVRDLETDLANKQDRIAKLEESIRRYIADFKEPNTSMLSIAGLESALETEMSDLELIGLRRRVAELEARCLFLEERLRDINEYNQCGPKDKDIERVLIAAFPAETHVRMPKDQADEVTRAALETKVNQGEDNV